MRLQDLIVENLHQALELLKMDAISLASGERAYIGVIELKQEWEDELPKLIHRYEKEIQGAYNSFKDPDHKDEAEWIKAHYQVTMKFLITHGLAKQVDDHI